MTLLRAASRTASVCFAYAICVAPMALAAPPQQTIYTCVLSVTRNQIWIPDQVVISVNKADGAVLVFDPIIRYFMSNPISAKVVVDTAARLTLKWNVTRINKVRPSNLPTIVYTAKLTRADNRIAINATPLGFDNRFYADGVCKIRD